MPESESRRIVFLEDIPNIGPAMARDLRLIGVETPAQLQGKNPFGMFERLIQVTGNRQDPCVLDVFISAVRFMEGGPPLPWWTFTAERKRLHPSATKE